MFIKSLTKVLIPIALGVLIYFYRSNINEDGMRAFMMAVCSGILLFSFGGAWKFLTDGTKIRIGKKVLFANYYLVYFAISCFFTYQIVANYSPYFFDDTAFTLRYLDNFSEGYFYHYNKLDPPVFGISSFLFGIFTGFWCWLHVFTPEESIHFTSFLGTVVLSFLVFKILREAIKEVELVFILWFTVMFGSKMFLSVVPSGMESPFQVSIVFAGLLFFLQGKSKWMWLFLALAVISKLDAVPFATVTGIIYLLLNRDKIFPLNLKNNFLKEIVVYAGIPLLLWIVFAFVVFGSPLPQSAYAKIHYHFHADDYWFPFLVYYVKEGVKVFVFWLFCGLFIAHIAYAVITGFRKRLKELIYGFAFLGSLILFYFYNPGERMGWYYSLPDLLLALQIAVSFYTFLSLIPYKSIRYAVSGFVFLIYMIKVGSDVIGGNYWMIEYLDNTERERNEVGIYIGNTVGTKDSLMSNHGLFARHVKGYVIDMSGLNSKFAGSYQIDAEPMIQDHRPKWAINHTSPEYADMMCCYDYEPARTFYDITNYNYPEWTLFKRIDGYKGEIKYFPVDTLKITNAYFSLEGSVSRFESDSMLVQVSDTDKSLKSFHFGIKRFANPITLVVAQYRGDSIIKMDSLEIKAIGDYSMDSKYTQAVVLQKAGESISKINIFTHPKGNCFTIIDPFLLTKKLD